MRHGKKVNHLGRTAPHRKALMANMASSLIKNKRITTTVAKAKALRTFVEPLITRSKDASTHNYRTVFSYLKDKEAVKELFTVVGDKVSQRAGGYTRILKIGNRMGDNAEMAFIELVDFNEFFTGFGTDKKAASKKTRRGRTKAAAAVTAKPAAVVAAPVVEEVAEEVAPEVEEVVETAPVAEVEAPAVEEVVEVVEETAPAAEESAPETTEEAAPETGDEEKKED